MGQDVEIKDSKNESLIY